MDRSIPQPFIWRRLHSLTGLFFSLFLIEHLLVNSQAALFIGDDGEGFVNAVNSIHNFPYLPVLEIFLLGAPILTHMILGIKYLQTSQVNSYGKDPSQPLLAEYKRNHAYTWQRITSWVLLFGVVAHVVHMRFIEEPVSVKIGAHHHYLVRVNRDEGLASLATRLDVKLIDAETIESEKINPSPDNLPDPSKAWIEALTYHPLKPGQVMAQAPDFGTAELLVVRESFKSPLMISLYTIFVLSACFHGFNGLWTFMITWGITLTDRSQKLMLKASTSIMVIVTFFGLAAIWGTYWLNLKQ